MGISSTENSTSNVDPHYFPCFLMAKAYSPLWNSRCQDGRDRLYIPTHRGGLSVQIPEARHSSRRGPCSVYPAAQWKLHCEVKEKFPRGWWQSMSTCWRRSGSPHSLTAGTKYRFFYHCWLKDKVRFAESWSYVYNPVLLDLVLLYGLHLGK